MKYLPTPHFLVTAGLLLLLGAVGAAFAAPVSMTWDNPLTNTDGSIIPATGPGSLTSNKVQRGTCSAPSVFGTLQTSYTTATAVEAFVTPDLLPATYCFRVTVTNTYGAESAVSPTVQKIVPVPVPNPPTAVTFVATLYELRKAPATGKYWVVRSVGYAPKGSACVNAALLKDYYKLDPTATKTITVSNITGVISGRCKA